MENRKKIIRKLNLNSNINKFILAKSLFSLNCDDEFFLKKVASCILNRIVYEVEVYESIPDVVKIFTSVLFFPSWKNFNIMDSIDTKTSSFKKCLMIADCALSGNLKDVVNGALEFYKENKLPYWVENISCCLCCNGYCFYNTYI